MPFLVANSVTVNVSARSSPTARTEKIGDRARMFNAQMREQTRELKKQWTVETVPMTEADAATLYTALTSVQPIPCSGDMTGSLNCFVNDLNERWVATPGGYRKVLSFVLDQV